jgi:hypothetical protein
VSWTGAGPLALAAALLAAGCRAHQGGPGARLPAPPAAAGGAVVEEKPIQLAGRDGIECRFLSTAHEPPHPLVMRALRVGDREYVVSASPRRGEGLPADAAAFLDSFEILEGSR